MNPSTRTAESGALLSRDVLNLFGSDATLGLFSTQVDLN